MTDQQDDFSFIPTFLDRERLLELTIDGRVEAENGSWVVLRYPPKLKDPLFKEFALVMNPDIVQGGPVLDMASTAVIISYLVGLENRRRKKK